MSMPPSPLPSFDFATAGRIRFGRGTASELPGLLRDAGSRPFVVTGSRPERLGPLAEGLEDLAGPRAGWWIQRGEPSLEDARRAVDQARAPRADVVVAVGGGSVIDLGKAVAMLLANGGDPLDYAEGIGRGTVVTRPSVPFLAAPTTAGTGAEVTRNAVLSSPQHRVKVSLRSPWMLPAVALVDSELGREVPPEVTAASGMDALVQLLEAFVSRKALFWVEPLCREGLRRGVPALPRAVRDGGDAEARDALAFAALSSGIALAHAGLGAVHGLAGPLGGLLDAPHGSLCAALLGPAIRVNLTALASREPDGTARHRYAQAAEWVTGRPDPEALADWADRTVHDLGIPGLRHWGLEEATMEAAVPLAARANSMKTNPVDLEPDEVRVILERAR